MAPSTRSQARTAIAFGLLIATLFYAIEHSNVMYTTRARPDLEIAVEKVTTGSMSRQMGLAFVGLGGLMCLLKRKRSNALRDRDPLVPICFLFFLTLSLSILWSDAPIITFKRVGSLALMAIGAAGIGSCFTHRQLALSIFTACLATAVFSLTCEFALGTFRPLEAQYRFSGIMAPLGQSAVCSFGILAGLAYTLSSRKRLALTIIIGLLVGLLVLTKARSAMLALLVALCLQAVIATRVCKEGDDRKYLNNLLGIGPPWCMLFA
jgi:hypothetical protein